MTVRLRWLVFNRPDMTWSIDRLRSPMNPITCTPGIDGAHPAVISWPPREPSLAAEVAMERWRPSPTYTKKEQFILKRLATKRKLFAFLRRHRHEIFDDAFQEELESMYRDTGAGKEPKPPALMAMALLLQGYTGLSDSDAVEALATRARHAGGGRAGLLAGSAPRWHVRL